MNIEMFKKVFNHVLKNHHRAELRDNSAEYHGFYDGKPCKIKFKNLGFDRYVYMNDICYHTTYVGGDYAHYVNIERKVI